VKQDSSWCKKILKQHLIDNVRERKHGSLLREGELQERPQFIFAILPVIPRITAENKEKMVLSLSSAKCD